jgi:hypothetical protein
MRFLMTVAIGLALALASYGCGGAADRQEGAQSAGDGAAATASPAQGMVDVAARIAREIEARPDQADAILERYGKTREEFEAMLYDIAADPDLSRAYKEARGR